MVYICESYGLKEVADYWHQVIKTPSLPVNLDNNPNDELPPNTRIRIPLTLQVVLMNDYQKRRFAHKMVKSMFNTITGKKVSTPSTSSVPYT